MAGYGIKGFLIAQSPQPRSKRLMGANNAILDNCHVRVAFATNDERTAKRVSDALGTATEMRDSPTMPATGFRPWLGHLMVSRRETARPLLTPGEIMQLPPTDEIVMVAGTPPVRATKARYFEDARFRERILIRRPNPGRRKKGRRWKPRSADDWSGRASRRIRGRDAAGTRTDGPPIRPAPASAAGRNCPEHEDDRAAPTLRPEQEFDLLDDEPDVDAPRPAISASA